MDSPGHLAQYFTYIFMENTTHRILHIAVMDKHMTGERVQLFPERNAITSW